MIWRWASAVIILPGTVLLLVPWLLVWLFRAIGASPRPALPGDLEFWATTAAAVVALALMPSTSFLFLRIGMGTAAPWDPPKRFVVCGPYRHVRNPMITGVVLMLVAEALLLRSWPIAGWALLFFAGNCLYFPLVEEKGLEKRFGDDYRLYRSNVPRWIPRLKGWDMPDRPPP
jgi:protein-S-isoprenylcysteine O-methyltransferase Ste14